jgi:dTDP-4-dehydrorhamnose 3,5-epimerase
MDFKETPLKDAYVIHLKPFTDERGYFVRMFCKDEFSKIGFNKEFVQMNHAMNKHNHTFRGFHFQFPPFSETKLIRCVSGKVQDYIIDIRRNSPTFLQSFTIELSESSHQVLLVPEGFAHGYVTLRKNSGLIYFHTAFYKPGFDSGLRYNDPRLDVKLPVTPEIVSEKDLNYPFIDDLKFNGLEI